MKKSNRIGIIHPFAHFDSVPALVSTVLLLSRQGYLVDVFTRFEETYVEPEFNDARISILPLDIPPRSARKFHLKFLPDKLFRWAQLRARNASAPYCCVVGVDPSGLVAAESFARAVNVPLIYYSLELLLSYEISTPWEKELKEQERRLSRESAFIIIQDEERGSLLRKDNHLPPDKFCYVPNAPLGRASRERSDYLERKMGVPPNSKIVLHSGALQPWSGALHLIKAADTWPHDWRLVCHSRRRAQQGFQAYFESLKFFSNPSRVFFSMEPLPYDVYPKVVRSADVGVAFYYPGEGRDLQDNIRYIGLSSGKLAYYLQAGLPVIVNDLPSLRRLISEYECGCICETPDSITECLEQIFSEYDRYSENAMRCYDAEFNFEEKFAPVMGRIKTLPCGRSLRPDQESDQ